MIGTTTQQALLKLDFLVVGGGIAGLSAAYVLGRAGHRVRVLERQEGLGSPAAGIRVPPNMSKILMEWFGAEELAKSAHRCVGSPFIDQSGEQIGYAHWRPAVMKEAGGDYLLMHHEDLHRMLHELAVSVGAVVEFGVDVVSVASVLRRPSATLSTGEVLAADVIIGADGPASLVRRTVLDREEDGAIPHSISVFSTTIPAREILKDPHWLKVVQSEEWPIFAGSNRSFNCHPVRSQKELSLHIFWPDEDVSSHQPACEGYSDIVPTSQLNLVGCSPDIVRLIKLAPTLIRSQWINYTNGIQDYVDSSGRIVLIGEAAHPCLPAASYNASIAVEDAVVLGGLFKHLSEWDQIPSFLEAYQDIRKERAEKLKELDISNAHLVWRPRGHHRDAGTEVRLAQVDWEGHLKAEFDQIAEVLAYDARDAAEEWWVNWGKLRESARKSQSFSPDDANLVSRTFAANGVASDMTACLS